MILRSLTFCLCSRSVPMWVIPLSSRTTLRREELKFLWCFMHKSAFRVYWRVRAHFILPTLDHMNFFLLFRARPSVLLDFSAPWMVLRRNMKTPKFRVIFDSTLKNLHRMVLESEHASISSEIQNRINTERYVRESKQYWVVLRQRS